MGLRTSGYCAALVDSHPDAAEPVDSGSPRPGARGTPTSRSGIHGLLQLPSVRKCLYAPVSGKPGNLRRCTYLPLEDAVARTHISAQSHAGLLRESGISRIQKHSNSFRICPWRREEDRDRVLFFLRRRYACAFDNAASRASQSSRALPGDSGCSVRARFEPGCLAVSALSRSVYRSPVCLTLAGHALFEDLATWRSTLRVVPDARDTGNLFGAGCSPAVR